MREMKSPDRPSLEILAVKWTDLRSPAGNGEARPRDLATARIEWIDVVCNVCHLEFRAVRAVSAVQPGFYPMVFSVTIGCECGAVVGVGVDQLKQNGETR